jgi:hypothetical protein
MSDSKKLLSKKDLRTRGWTHRQIREFPASGQVIKTGERGRPAFGYDLSKVVAEEKARK